MILFFSKISFLGSMFGNPPDMDLALKSQIINIKWWKYFLTDISNSSKQFLNSLKLLL